MERLQKSRFSRFSKIDWIEKTLDVDGNPAMVLIGGCGGIGSWLTFMLARIGMCPCVYDHDIVEEHNVSGQLLKTKHNRKAKVLGMAEIISEFTGEQHYHMFNNKIDENTPSHTWCFSAFDNMKARKIMFESWLEANKEDKEAIFIDGRLRAEAWEIFCIRIEDEDRIEKYKTEFLFSDTEVEDEPCSNKQTSHMAAMIGSLMCGFFTNHLTNLVEDEKVREVPFFTSYHLPLNYWQ